MSTLTLAIPSQQLNKTGINKPCIHYQLSAEELTEQTLQRHEGVLNDTEALCVLTGQFTGRCPKDKFMVADSETKATIDWNGFNQPIDEKYFFSTPGKAV
jgi:phosphoenolpyruvate carboxykinase (ATP)